MLVRACARPLRPQPSAHPIGPPAAARSRLLGWPPLRRAHALLSINRDIVYKWGLVRIRLSS